MRAKAELFITQECYRVSAWMRSRQNASDRFFLFNGASLPVCFPGPITTSSSRPSAASLEFLTGASAGIFRGRDVFVVIQDCFFFRTGVTFKRAQFGILGCCLIRERWKIPSCRLTGQHASIQLCSKSHTSVGTLPCSAVPNCTNRWWRFFFNHRFFLLRYFFIKWQTARRRKNTHKTNTPHNVKT